ncbi:proteasome complex subunit rpn13 ubiquitin receptor domain-containing protein [Hirsutella rhossiliensis]|uniref:Proteasome complex subunit rpn13 ubiquitin receptor domain-containing protein n=1 Tax=Hirsutella rhossiliensis TaxID=111463 RepID=A0A9P8N5P0_9HYPO|nr:proteasome complex subunit rpn13 ubiquitin receptor domain-containing protein [Hirsutella rhossiliensis]KAH0967239.1 proteasome complex subunit rpn13 ubiquitin receptor domain-containing protein [Hirsutella rhossiliensis]
MPISPIITFKAGQCDLDTSSTPAKVKPQPQPGYIYLYSEDDLVHFCWRKRDDSLDEPELDLVMVPTDGSFVPYDSKSTAHPTAKTNGRIFALKFASSSQRYLFWMQSKPQSRNGDAAWFSPRDRKIGAIVHRLLQGEEVNVSSELAAVRNTDNRRDDDDEPMEDVEGLRGPHNHRGSGSGGAGPDATGGDIREEGEGSREGGADGARAASSSAPDAAAAVRNFLESLRDQPGLSGRQQQQQQQQSDLPYPHLSHLLPTSITVSMMETASSELVESLLGLLPPAVMVLASGSSGFDGRQEPTTEMVEAAKASLSPDDKRSLLKKVMRSPQFHQALGSLTMALRDGGLPGVADALGVKVENGGYIRDGGMPMGGGHAVRAFVEGVKTTVREENP